jgi:hypothetical protein
MAAFLTASSSLPASTSPSQTCLPGRKLVSELRRHRTGIRADQAYIVMFDPPQPQEHGHTALRVFVCARHVRAVGFSRWRPWSRDSRGGHLRTWASDTSCQPTPVWRNALSRLDTDKSFQVSHESQTHLRSAALKQAAVFPLRAARTSHPCRPRSSGGLLHPSAV